eukprot:2278941-Amphidinium_carterae.1
MGVDQHMEEIQDAMCSAHIMTANDRHLARLGETHYTLVSSKATAELALEEMLEKVKKTWEQMDLIVNPYKDEKLRALYRTKDQIAKALACSGRFTGDSIHHCRLLCDLRMSTCQEHDHMSLQKILGAGTAPLLQTSVLEAAAMLGQSETLDEWLNVQRNWMYLESIFGAGDIKKQFTPELLSSPMLVQHRVSTTRACPC